MTTSARVVHWMHKHSDQLMAAAKQRNAWRELSQSQVRCFGATIPTRELTSVRIRLDSRNFTMSLEAKIQDTVIGKIFISQLSLVSVSLTQCAECRR